MLLAVALVLLIFAVTSGTSLGWGSAGVLAPLIISVFMIAGSLYYETTVPADCAAIPPRTWFLPNFLVLFVTALLPYLWWTTMFTISTTLWQDVWHWSAISLAIHMYACSPLTCLILRMLIHELAGFRTEHWHLL